MLTRTGLIIALAVAAMLIVGCGGTKYENAASVISAAEKHKIDGCSNKLFGMIGATDGVDCNFNDGLSVEIYTFNGDAKSACEKNRMCNELLLEEPLAIRFTDNAMIWLGDQPKSVLDALIADIED